MRTLLLIIVICSFRINQVREEFIDYPTILRDGWYEAYTV